MGVPAFFRWLCKKYPSIVVHAVEEKAKKDPYTDKKLPIDTAQPNPNGVEFDNLYLDMNGIIHPCTHPEDRPAPQNEDEMMVIIFEFIDRLFSIVRPRKLLYMAIDGVAPRAKMNQQRSRRFRAAKESTEKQNEIRRLKTQIISNGGVVPADKPAEEHFDSNCITPGTPFMHKLAQCLRYYIHDRLNNDPGWKNVKVILSDANVPGEGEHKIMDFIRRQRANPDHDPNTHHVLCGADADLIMLGLATHEPYFTIIREEFKPDRPRPCEICNQFGHETKDCTGIAREKKGKHDEFAGGYVPTESNYIFLRLSVLREYLQRDLYIHHLPFKFDIERIVDDWVFLCFFVGNDFLPHLPSLEIREGAIDRLVTLYKQILPQLNDYLTNNGYVNLELAERILNGIGQVEDDIFKRRQQREEDYKRRVKDQKRRNRGDRGQTGDNQPMKMPEWMKTGPFAPTPLMNIKQQSSTSVVVVDEKLGDLNRFMVEVKETEIIEEDGKKGVKRKHIIFDTDEDTNAKNRIKATDEAVVVEEVSKIETEATVAPTLDGEEEEEVINDDVRLWEDGWRERYYKVKFDVSENDMDFRHKVAQHYAIGLCWVLRYYYQGVPAWNWYFPYHYAPFASDFKGLDRLDSNNMFDSNTEPFKPFEQLMAVFPAASKKHIPTAFQKLMYSIDSEILDFYPEDFQVDLNGKKQAWQGVALLPFVDEKRLKEALVPYYSRLNEEEVKRNVRGNDYLFVHKTHKLFSHLNDDIYTTNEKNKAIDLNTELSDGVAGKVWLDENYPRDNPNFVRSPITYLCPDLQNNQALSVKYRDPQYEIDYVFKSIVLEGARLPEPTLKPQDWNQNNNGQQYRPYLGFNRDDGYRPNKDASVANRMLQYSLNVNADGSSDDKNCISSAYGGHNSNYYGSYRTNSNRNYQRNDSYNDNYQQQQQQGYNNQRQYNNNNRQYQQGGGAGGGGQYNNNNNYYQQPRFNNNQNYNRSNSYDQQQQQQPRYQNQQYYNNNNNQRNNDNNGNNVCLS